MPGSLRLKIEFLQRKQLEILSELPLFCDIIIGLFRILAVAFGAGLIRNFYYPDLKFGKYLVTDFIIYKLDLI
jgi:hypothetical protein